MRSRRTRSRAKGRAGKPARGRTVPPRKEIPITPRQLRRLGRRLDVLLVSGDAYCDHPSFGTAVVARFLESFGLTVAVAAQPDPNDVEALAAFGRPRLFVGVSAGNMDSMVANYTSHKRKRRTDAYSPGGQAGRRPDRAVLVYANLARRAFPDALVLLGGIEASLRRFAHYDYWQDDIRRSILLDAKADLLVYGMAERPLRAILDRLREVRVADRSHARLLEGIRGTAFAVTSRRMREEGFTLEDGAPSPFQPKDLGLPPGPFRDEPEPPSWRVRLLPAYEDVREDPTHLAEATRIVERSQSPHLGEVLVQRHGTQFLVVMPPAFPLSPAELDYVHELPYLRHEHSSYREKVPAMEVVRHSIQILRGCFGGCAFCAVGLHQGRIVQSRSEDSILREARDVARAHKGRISDLGGPTANMWRMGGRNEKVCRTCRRPSCLWPEVCPNLDTDHRPLRRLYAAVRELPEVRRAVVSSGIRYDIALRDPDYVADLVRYHVGGHLHVAPEHADPEVLRLARKPPYEVFEAFQRLFEKLKARFKVDCYLNPYFMSGLPGSTQENTRALVRLLRRQGWKPRQVQSFLPTPGTAATATYVAGVSPDDPDRPVPMPRSLKAKIRQHRLLVADLPDDEPRKGRPRE